jgi:uncharacterized protein YeaO (DUF488 family)
VKKQIRNLDRQLNHKREKLPANVIVDKERALKALKVQLRNLQGEQQVKVISKKYKLVRFFESKKALRAYKSVAKQYKDLEAQYQENSDDKELKKQLKKLRKQLSHAEVDLVYVANFPYDKKYISLYPKKLEESQVDENVKIGLKKTDADRNAYRKEFEQKLKNGELELSVKDILEGKSNHNIVSERDQGEEEEDDAPDAAQVADEEDDDFFE